MYLIYFSILQILPLCEGQRGQFKQIVSFVNLLTHSDKDIQTFLSFLFVAGFSGIYPKIR